MHKIPIIRPKQMQKPALLNFQQHRKKVEDAQTALDEAKQNQERLNSTLAAAQQELTELENQISEASSELERSRFGKKDCPGSVSGGSCTGRADRCQC